MIPLNFDLKEVMQVITLTEGDRVALERVVTALEDEVVEANKAANKNNLYIERLEEANDNAESMVLHLLRKLEDNDCRFRYTETKTLAESLLEIIRNSNFEV